VLEGYLLTGRHGFLSTYESFVHVIDSMVNEHCKWLEISHKLSRRAPVSTLNLLITSTVWRQDHNGFTHQDPGFLDIVSNKSPDIVRVYQPPDVNSLLSVADHCLRQQRLRQRDRRRQAAALAVPGHGTAIYPSRSKHQ
jgi:xylulose-5-phosphate/fructose-6-phosphate phosphoketolase